MKYLLILTLLISCGSENDEWMSILDPTKRDPSSYIHPKLQPYVHLFTVEGLARGIDVRPQLHGLTIDFVGIIPDTPTAAGACILKRNRVHLPKVIISLAHWDKMSNAQKEFTVTHELGHCLRFTMHDAKSKLVTSFMAPKLPNKYQMLNADYKSLYDNLFNRN